jgi:hypothetical protein
MGNIVTRRSRGVRSRASTAAPGTPFRFRRRGRTPTLRRTHGVLAGRDVEIVEDAQGVVEVSEIRRPS